MATDEKKETNEIIILLSSLVAKTGTIIELLRTRFEMPNGPKDPAISPKAQTVVNDFKAGEPNPPSTDTCYKCGQIIEWRVGKKSGNLWAYHPNEPFPGFCPIKKEASK
jgi:hypothetical protein